MADWLGFLTVNTLANCVTAVLLAWTTREVRKLRAAALHAHLDKAVRDERRRGSPIDRDE